MTRTDLARVVAIIRRSDPIEHVQVLRVDLERRMDRVGRPEQEERRRPCECSIPIPLWLLGACKRLSSAMVFHKPGPIFAAGRWPLSKLSAPFVLLAASKRVSEAARSQ